MVDQPLRPSAVLAGQVRHWRTRRKLSAQGLADRIAELGGDLNRAAVSRIENDTRGVSLDEWLQLAHALAVPPPLLMCDLSSGQPVAVADSAVMHPWLLWEWICGESAPVVTGNRVTRVEEWQASRRAIHLYRQEREAALDVHDAEYDVKAAEYAGDPERRMTARNAQIDALFELAKVLDAMVEADIVLPGKPPDWVEDIRGLRLSKYPDKLVVFEPEGDDAA